MEILKNYYECDFKKEYPEYNEKTYQDRINNSFSVLTDCVWLWTLGCDISYICWIDLEIVWYYIEKIAYVCFNNDVKENGIIIWIILEKLLEDWIVKDNIRKRYTNFYIF